MPDPRAVPDTRAGVALALAFVAGAVDVIRWLALDRLYTSHVTGDTAAIGIELAVSGRHRRRGDLRDDQEGSARRS